MRSSNPLQILIADDNAFVREGLSALLARQHDLCVVATAANGQEAIDLFRRHRPCVVLMDLRMPCVDGVQATHTICAEFPNAAILIFTTFVEETDISRALAAGARGYLLKDTSRTDLMAAIRTLASKPKGSFNA